MWLPLALQQIIEHCPEQVAVCSNKDETLSYQALWQRSDVLAANMALRNIGHGSRVAILSANSIDSIVALWSIWKCGATSVYLNEHLTASGLQQILDDVQPQLILAEQKLLTKLHEKSPPILPETMDLSLTAEHASTIDSTNAISPVAGTFDDSLKDASADETIAAIIYTSGSTGKPKGVCLTHTNLWTVVQADTAGLSITADDSYLMAVPLHYVHGLLQLLVHQLAGAKIHLLNSFMFPKLVTRRLQETGASGFSGVPFHISALIDRGDLLNASLPSLRWIGVTGGRLAVDRVKQLRTAHTAIDIHISYGQTESSPRITALNPQKIDRKPDSVGSPPSGITVKLVNEDGHTVTQGQVGEVLVSGANVMAGYWADDLATARVIDSGGWLHTGDLGFFDGDGDLFLKGRKQAMIKSAGERIFPEELEQVLLLHSGVLEAAVVGVPDKLYGQRVEAHVVHTDAQQPKDNMDATSVDDDGALDEQLRASIHEFCLVHIPFIRAPKHYHFWQSLPTKANGKIDREALIHHCEEIAKRRA